MRRKQREHRRFIFNYRRFVNELSQIKLDCRSYFERRGRRSNASINQLPERTFRIMKLLTFFASKHEKATTVFFFIRRSPLLPRKHNLISRHMCRANRLVFHASRHGSSRMVYAFRPMPSAFRLPSYPNVGIYRTIEEYRKSWGSLLALNFIFVSSRDFSGGIPSTLIRGYHSLPSLVCSSEPTIGEHWVITPIFHGWSSRRAASQQACPLGYFGKDKVPTSPALIGHEQVTYVCKVWPSWRSNMPHRRRLTPVFSLSLFGLPEDWRESDELNNSLEDTLRERTRERERGKEQSQQQYPQNFQRPAILYLYSLGGGSGCERRWIKCARARVHDSCFTMREGKREDARL